MNKWQYLTFLTDYESVIEDIINDFFGPCEKIMKAIFTEIEIRNLAEIGTLGILLDGLCDKVNDDVIRLSAQKAVSEAAKYIRLAVGEMNTALAITAHLYQTWDAVPEWDEYKKYLEDMIENKLIQLINLALPALIKQLVCGTKMNIRGMFQMKGVFSEQFVSDKVIESFKNYWDTFLD